MNARNEFETTFEHEELSDADLMAINGGSVGTVVSALGPAVDDLLVTLGTALTPILPPVGGLVGALGTANK